MAAMLRGSIRCRSAALWVTATAALVGIGAITAPPLADLSHTITRDPSFTSLLVSGCAMATLVAAGCLWVTTTEVVARVLLTHGRVVRRGGPLRLLLLTACGAIVVGATAGPATADDPRPAAPPSLAGLPLPDRATSAGRLPDHDEPAPRLVIRVQPGDSLWAIAERRLGADAAARDIARYWRRIYARNAATIGPDPDLIGIGQQLELPPPD